MANTRINVQFYNQNDENIVVTIPFPYCRVEKYEEIGSTVKTYQSMGDYKNNVNMQVTDLGDFDVTKESTIDYLNDLLDWTNAPKYNNKNRNMVWVCKKNPLVGFQITTGSKGQFYLSDGTIYYFYQSEIKAVERTYDESKQTFSKWTEIDPFYIMGVIWESNESGDFVQISKYSWAFTARYLFLTNYCIPYYDVKLGTFVSMGAFRSTYVGQSTSFPYYNPVKGYVQPIAPSNSTWKYKHPYASFSDGDEDREFTQANQEAALGKAVSTNMIVGSGATTFEVGKMAFVWKPSDAQKFFTKTDIPSYPDNPNPDKPDDPTIDPDPDRDPDEGDTSTGDGDTESDPVPTPTPPTDFTTKLISLYTMNNQLTESVGNFLWSDTFLDSYKKSITNPFDVVISLKYFGIGLPQGTATQIKFGNVQSGISAGKIDNRFVRYDIGNIAINEHFGSFLDYTPYTKISVYLPYIGTKQLDTDLVMNSTLHFAYQVDLMSGEVLCQIQVMKTITGVEGTTNINANIYQFSGNCAIDIPLTGGNSSTLQSGLSMLSRGISNMVAPTLGAMQGKSYGTAENYAFTQGFASNFDLGHVLQGAQNGLNLPIGVHVGTDYEKTSAGGGLFNVMCNKTLYLLIERPTRQIVNNYSKMYGLPLNQYGQLSQFKGYVEFNAIHADQVIGSEEEQAEIEQLLKSGVRMPS